MRAALFIAVLSFSGCAYPKFNLREPIYIVPTVDYLKACDNHGFRSHCLQTIVVGTEMWFWHLTPEKRPKIIITETPPGKTKNELIFVEVNGKIRNPAYFRTFPRPLAIVLKNIIIGVLATYFIGHEFGHAIVGPGHEPNRALMNNGDNASFIPVSSDIKKLHKKHPEL